MNQTLERQDTDTGLELVEQEELDEDIPCVSAQCDHAPAQWTAIWSCGDATDYCVLHYALTISALAWGEKFRCPRHDVDVDLVRWERIHD